MESLTLQVDGPITGRAIFGGAYNRNIFSVCGLMGLSYEPGGGYHMNRGGNISGILRYIFSNKNYLILDEPT